MEQRKTKSVKKHYFAYDLMRAVAMILTVFYHMNCEWSARLSVLKQWLMRGKMQTALIGFAA